MKSLLLALPFSLFGYGQSANEIVLTDENLGISLGENVGVFEDKTNAFPAVNALLELIDDPFVKTEQAIPDFNFTANRFWLRFTLTNHSSKTDFIFETGRTVTNKVEFFEVWSNLLMFSYKEHCKIILNPGSTQVFYVKFFRNIETLVKFSRPPT